MTPVSKLYWAHSLSSIGYGLIAVFVPIFLYSSGVSFVHILMYLLYCQLFSIPLLWLAAKSAARFGSHHTMAVGVVAMLIFLSLLITYEGMQWSLLLIAFAWAINRSFYYFALHTSFAHSRSQDQAGHQISWLNVATITTNGIAPAAGGAIATYFGMEISYIIALILVILAISPLLMSRDTKRIYAFKVSLSQLKEGRRDLAANFGNSITTAVDHWIWPMLIFFLLPAYVAIGLLTSVVGLVSVIITLIIGKREDKTKKGHFLTIGTSIESVVNTTRILASTPPLIFGVNMLSGISRAFYLTPFMAKYYKNSDGQHRLNYIWAMETVHVIGSALYALTFVILALFFSPLVVLVAGTVVAIPASFLIRLIR